MIHRFSIRLAVVLLIVASATHLSCLRKSMPNNDSKSHRLATRPSSGSPEKVHSDPSWWSEGGCSEVRQVSQVLGREPDALVKEMGPPTRKDQFMIGDRLDEFRIELQNTYPLSVSANRSVEVREWTWDRDHCHLTVWFHSVDGIWRCLNATIWPEGTEF